MKAHQWISSTVLVLALVGGSFATGRAQQDEKKDKQEEHKSEERKAAPQQHKEARPAPQQHQEHHDAAPPQEHRSTPQEEHRAAPPQQEQHQATPAHNDHRQQREQPRTQPEPQQSNQPRREERSAPPQEEHRTEHQEAAPAQQQSVPPRTSRTSRSSMPQTDQNHPTIDREQHARLPEDRQRQLIAQQQQRVNDYREHLNQQQVAVQRYDAQLQQQHREHQYQFEQAYWAREREQRDALARQYDYANNPYFYSAPTYRYYRGGQYYDINQYGADMINRAINTGYDQGYRMGIADRQDGWRGGYQNSFAYEDANYGYDGYYADQGTYNYYFRQGFSRGYDDGYGQMFRYGSYNNGSYSILGSVLSTIFRLQPLR